MSIQARVLEALRWTTATRLGGSLLTWAINLLVIRLLRPSDYGLMALCMVWIGLGELLGAFGQRAALVQRQQLDDALLRKVFGALLLWNALLFAFLQATAPLFAAFYADDTLVTMIRVMAISVFFSSLSVVPQALRWREIDFKAVSLVGLAQAVSTRAIVLLLAWRGLGVWALVAGQLGGALIHTAGILWVTRFRMWPDFRVRGLAADVRFGGLVVSRALVGYLGRQADAILIGKLLGSVPLGTYSVTSNLAQQPTRALLEPIQRVSRPAFARIQDDPARVAAYFLRSVETVGFVFVPMLWGLGVIADDLVTVALGERWLGTIPILQIMCVGLPFLSLLRILIPSLEGLGRPELALRHNATLVVCLPIGIAVGASWGLAGATVGWLAGHAVAAALNLRRALPALGTGFGALFGSLWPTFLAGAAMVAVVTGTRPALVGALDPLWRLPATAVLGAAGYLLGSLALNRATLGRTARLVRG